MKNYLNCAHPAGAAWYGGPAHTTARPRRQNIAGDGRIGVLRKIFDDYLEFF